MRDIGEVENKVLPVRVTFGIQHFIQKTIQKKMSWSTLSHLLTELATAPENSIEIIKTLLQELENWVSKVEYILNQKETCGPSEETSVAVIERIDQEEVESLEGSKSALENENSDSEGDTFDYNESIENNDENLNRPKEEMSHGNIQDVEGIDISQFYEFVGNHNDNKQGQESFDSTVDDENEVSETRENAVSTYEIINTSAESDLKVQFKCSLCPKTFFTKSTVSIHFKTHTGEDQVQCKICKKWYSGPGNLKLHEKIHSKDKAFQCMLCLKHFTRKDRLKAHENKHTGERNFRFQCSVCKKRFSRKEFLEKHERIHSEVTPYECKLCNKNLSRLESLKEHERRLHSIKYFLCKYCHQRFSRNRLLLEHYKTCFDYVPQ